VDETKKVRRPRNHSGWPLASPVQIARQIRLERWTPSCSSSEATPVKLLAQPPCGVASLVRQRCCSRACWETKAVSPHPLTSFSVQKTTASPFFLARLHEVVVGGWGRVHERECGERQTRCGGARAPRNTRAERLSTHRSSRAPLLAAVSDFEVAMTLAKKAVVGPMVVKTKKT
jgi:hypothetical protein